MWEINRTETLPLHKQTVRLIEDAIAGGTLAPGERLPSERNLARLLGVNRSTVILALDELADRGILLRKRGSGTYVTTEKWGVQSFAQVTWRQPPALLQPLRDNVFYREAAMLREEAARRGEELLDLSPDQIASDLLPEMRIPEHSWEEAVRAEQGNEAAHLGLAAFRETVQRFLRDALGLNAPLEEILITTGSRQAVFLITQCLLKPGDAVGVEAPSYYYSLPLFQAAGLRLYALPMDSGGVTLEGLEALAARRSIKMLFLNPVFQNPTGSVMGAARKKAVLDFCAKTHIPIVEDDAYSLLPFSPHTDIRPLKAQDMKNQVLYAGSLSSYAGRNLRTGWLIAPPGVINTLAQARHMMDAGLSALPQLLGAEYLEHTAAAHIPAARKTLAERAARTAEHLREVFGDALTFTPPAGGLYLYAKARETEAEKLRREFLRQGIIPALGEEFGDPKPSFRLNCSLYV